jgi:hypothetical protein
MAQSGLAERASRINWRMEIFHEEFPERASYCMLLDGERVIASHLTEENARLILDLIAAAKTQ